MAGLVAIDWSPETRTLRQFGLLALVGFGLLAAAAHFEALIFAFGLGSWRAPVVVGLAGVGALAALCSALAPRANLVLYRVLICLSYPIGWVVSNAILTALFFALFAPIGWALRLSGHDPLRRARAAAGDSYWSPARPPRSKESYFKQF